jgi:hypothetical protein
VAAVLANPHDQDARVAPVRCRYRTSYDALRAVIPELLVADVVQLRMLVKGRHKGLRLVLREPMADKELRLSSSVDVLDVEEVTSDFPFRNNALAVELS